MARTSIHWTRVSRVKEVEAQTVASAEELVVSTRRLIAERAREGAPVGGDGDRHPGELRDSIEVDGEEVVVGAPHGLFVEFGTVFMGAEPFFQPAIDAGRDLMRAAMGKSFIR